MPLSEKLVFLEQSAEKMRAWRLENPGDRRTGPRPPRDPIQKRAWNVVANRRRRGKLAPKSCEVCGAEPAQAHHDDYGNPLEIRWLCPEHHQAHHTALRAAL